MGFLDWIKGLLFGGAETRRRVFNRPGHCPYCGTALRTMLAQQCFTCGADWHDPANPRFVEISREQSEAERRFVAEQGPLAPAQPSRTGGVSMESSHAPPSQERRRSSSLEGLDASNFKPISRAEMLLQLSVRRMGFWWGMDRQSEIPPTNDARTKIIDRAMVTQGLITPEELGEIHEVGAEMDRLRPTLRRIDQIAHDAAVQAVAQGKEEREALKLRKKQEAAERKRKYEEDVARRRATDIVFLGRGVSRGLADRRANVEKLESLDLPVLATPQDVAAALDVTIPRLRWLAFHSEAAERVHYVRFTAPKRSGGLRELSAPHRDLKRTQEWILREILDKIPTHDAAHGFVRGRSTVSNAAVHSGAGVLLNTDLTDFFPSVTFPRVMGVFKELGYSPAAATILALLCTEAPRRTVAYAGRTLHVASGPRALPQGACTSPAISNLVTRRLDARLAGLADKLGWRYTRYADDATFSTPEAATNVGYVMARIRHIVQDEGFTINEKKTRVLRPNTSQTVTGVVVNERPNAPRKLVRKLRAILHNAKHEGLQSQNRENLPNFEAWLHGMIAYVTMINPDQGRPLQQALQDIEA